MHIIGGDFRSRVTRGRIEAKVKVEEDKEMSAAVMWGWSAAVGEERGLRLEARVGSGE
ncbi:MAG: hypothetical protein GTO13_16795 [Proteobacteria bacterium]|nr:hypothetical protein [Pseudomonadota bacterium]